jgi:hypothetical protein
MASLAASKYDTDLSTIIKCCRGKVKSAMGRVYSYAEPSAFGWTKV